MTRIGAVANGLLSLTVLAIAIPGILHAAPQLVGANGAYVVLTGSMTPTLRVGDLVFVKAGPVEVGDVITFHATSGSKELVTHRVVAVREDSFVTKGDANAANDPRPVAAEDVVGKVDFKIPAWGLVSMFARTTLGYVTLILIPGLAIIMHQVQRIRKARKEARS